MGDSQTVFAEYLRHHLAHAQDVASGRGRRGCPFCPTLKVKPGRSTRGILREGLFSQRFLRNLTKDLNKIGKMAMDGHEEAGRFLETLKTSLKGRPWDKPPSSPGAILASAGGTESILEEQFA